MQNIFVVHQIYIFNCLKEKGAKKGRFGWDGNRGEERAMLACGEGAVGDSVISTQLYPTMRTLP